MAAERPVEDVTREILVALEVCCRQSSARSQNRHDEVMTTPSMTAGRGDGIAGHGPGVPTWPSLVLSSATGHRRTEGRREASGAIGHWVDT